MSSNRPGDDFIEGFWIKYAHNREIESVETAIHSVRGQRVTRNARFGFSSDIWDPNNFYHSERSNTKSKNLVAGRAIRQRDASTLLDMTNC